MRTVVSGVLAPAFLLAACCMAHATSLPRDPSRILLIGDSITAGIYFLSMDDITARQAWSGQLLRRLGLEAPRGPESLTYPINHLGLAQLGFTVGGTAYMWEARRAFMRGGPRYGADDERAVLAIPGQTLEDVLVQSSLSSEYNRHSAGWTFANLMLPKGLTSIETVEQWQKRPEWIVLFIGSNDLLAFFGIVGNAVPPEPDEFEKHYRELVSRLLARMAPGTPAAQFIVLTLPDVTRLPFLQPLPANADDGNGGHYPPGTMTSAFLEPYRDHYQPDEVWTPAQLDTVRELARAYTRSVRTVASEHGFTVVAIDALMDSLSADPLFGSSASPYFSPDLQHPSYRTHGIIADQVANAMSMLSGETVPPLVTNETPLPHAGDFTDKQKPRVTTMMHLGLVGLAAGPLPPSFTGRFSFEAGLQAGNQRTGDAVLSMSAGFESPPCPLGTYPVARVGMSLHMAALASDWQSGETTLFPAESGEARLGLAVERIAAWTWARTEVGGLLTLDGEWDGGLYVRGEWRWLYLETAGRGFWFDRVEAGARVGLHPGRMGRNGN